METPLKTGFAQIFSCCPKNLSRPKFGGGCSPARPPGPYTYARYRIRCDSKRGSLKALESKMSICFAVLLFNIAVALAGKEEAVFIVKLKVKW